MKQSNAATKNVLSPELIQIQEDLTRIFQIESEDEMYKALGEYVTNALKSKSFVVKFIGEDGMVDVPQSVSGFYCFG